jgi:hypothetical protein
MHGQQNAKIAPFIIRLFVCMLQQEDYYKNISEKLQKKYTGNFEISSFLLRLDNFKKLLYAHMMPNIYFWAHFQNKLHV